MFAHIHDNLECSPWLAAAQFPPIVVVVGDRLRMATTCLSSSYNRNNYKCRTSRTVVGCFNYYSCSATVHTCVRVCMTEMIMFILLRIFLFNKPVDHVIHYNFASAPPSRFLPYIYIISFITCTLYFLRTLYTYIHLFEMSKLLLPINVHKCPC